MSDILNSLYIFVLAGFIGFAVQPGSPWIEILAALFGIGVGLTLDEFALWLYLEDVYWSEEGRRSIDAVIVALTFFAVSILKISLPLVLVTLGPISVWLYRPNASPERQPGEHLPFHRGPRHHLFHR